MKKLENGNKICSSCKVEKHIGSFGKHKGAPDGFAYSCKECEKAKYQAKKEQKKASVAAYRQANLEAIKQKQILQYHLKKKADNGSGA